MPMILVADDSEIDRAVILDILRKEPLDWLIEVVESAEAAIHLMREIAFDVVITDVQMTGMSGLDLMNQVHRQPQRVPVIVISGHDDQSAAVEALRQGAASYVAKKELAARLGETVRQVLESARTEQNYQHLISCADEMRFKFELRNDPSLIQPLINLLQRMSDGMNLLSSDARTRLGVAIDEAVINAMCHGNLELNEDEMSEVHRHLHSSIPIEAIASRASMKPYCDRTVHVSAGISKEGIKIVVRDDGKGFSPATVGDNETHRGITLIRNLVDKATFSETGNEITLVKFRDQQEAAESLENQPA